jgi:predicted DnaQ family exonuclease/DinG family helicase
LAAKKNAKKNAKKKAKKKAKRKSSGPAKAKKVKRSRPSRKKRAPATAGERPVAFVEVRLAEGERLGSGAAEVAARTGGAKFHEYVRVKPGVMGSPLTAKQRERARPLEDVRRELVDFATDAVVATRNAPALRAAFPRSFDESDILDLGAFARAVAPELPGFGASDLAKIVSEPVEPEADVVSPENRPSRRTLVAEVEVTRDVHERLEADLAALPLAVLTEAAWLLARDEGPVSSSFRRAEAAAKAERGVDAKALRDLFPEQGERIRAAREERIPGEPGPLEEDIVDEVLGPEGAVAQSLEQYEDRPEQREMSRLVARALSEGRHLLAEGGTGVGKSLAYLAPAVAWARRYRRPVIVATYTKNLQAQLFEKDLPLLEKALGGEGEFKTALIKGRRNYLCLRKLYHMLRASEWELDPPERAGLVGILVWAVRTGSGDLSDCNAFAQAGPRSLRDKLTTSGDECMGKRCAQFGQCFLQAARAASLEADVVVANHALVFAELGLDTPVLPEYQEIVFDEAQHVEDVATEHLAVRASRARTMRTLSRIFRSPRRSSGAGTGLLATAFQYLSNADSKVSAQFAVVAHEAISAAAEDVRAVADAADDFFAAAAEIVAGANGRRRRYRKDGRTSITWQRVFKTGREFEGELTRLADLVDIVTDVLGRDEAKGVYARREMAIDLRAQAANLREQAHDVGFVLAGEAEGYVFWVEEEGFPRGDEFASLSAAPVEVAELLRQQLLDQKRSVICTSATLTVSGGFDFMAGRLGFDLSERGNTDVAEVGSPFDYARQARVFVPRFLPDPRSERSFIEGLSELLVALFAASGGKGLALFTSYSMLDAVRGETASALAAKGVRVLAQGRDGSREALLATLRAGGRTALLATSSFWEGVDVPGEALSVLVVARLPFHVFTEPVVEARCEAIRAAGEDAFMTYTLPSAVLRLRQGFGRLIRTKTDRGVVVIADPRIITKGYGREFRESLPVVPETSSSASALVREAKAFLEGRAEGPARVPRGGSGTRVRAARAVPGEEAPGADDGTFFSYGDVSDQEESPFLD